MNRFAMIAGASFALLWIATPAAAHGCHAGWQQAPKEGWHSHGSKCEPRNGVGVSNRTKQKEKEKEKAREG